VRERVRGWLRELAQQGEPTLAVTHRGVIRAILSDAFGWDMLGKPPAKLDWQAVHLFKLDPLGAPRVEQLNLR
jgi:probable phosphoglycerate mutase